MENSQYWGGMEFRIGYITIVKLGVGGRGKQNKLLTNISEFSKATRAVYYYFFSNLVYSQLSPFGLMT